MRLHSRGGAVVEFALLIPFIFLLTSTMTALGSMVVAQFRLESVCAQVARRLATSELIQPAELQAFAEAEVAAAGVKAGQVTVARHSVPVKPAAPPRQNRPLEMIELTLRTDGIVPLIATVWEPRAQP